MRSRRRTEIAASSARRQRCLRTGGAAGAGTGTAGAGTTATGGGTGRRPPGSTNFGAAGVTQQRATKRSALISRRRRARVERPGRAGVHVHHRRM